jgi:hypothetical protein
MKDTTKSRPQKPPSRPKVAKVRAVPVGRAARKPKAKPVQLALLFDDDVGHAVILGRPAPGKTALSS